MIDCDHDRLLAYLRRSPYRSERVWLPLARLSTRFAHRHGGCSLAPQPADNAQAGEPKPYLCGCPSDDPRPCPLHDSDSADNAHTDGAS